MENKRDFLQIELALLLKLAKCHVCPAKVDFSVGGGEIDARTERRKKVCSRIQGFWSPVTVRFCLYTGWHEGGDSQIQHILAQKHVNFPNPLSKVTGKSR